MSQSAVEYNSFYQKGVCLPHCYIQHVCVCVCMYIYIYIYMRLALFLDITRHSDNFVDVSAHPIP
jgi:hypothetical protein